MADAHAAHSSHAWLLACVFQLAACSSDFALPSAQLGDASADASAHAGEGGSNAANGDSSTANGADASQLIDANADANAVPEQDAGSRVICARGSSQDALPLLTERHWAAPDRVRSPGGEVQGARAAINAQGQAAVVWSEYDGARYHVWIARYAKNTGWASAHQLDPETPAGTEPIDRAAPGQDVSWPGDARFPNVFLAPNGEVFVTWTQIVDATIPLPRERTWYSHGTPEGVYTSPGESPFGGLRVGEPRVFDASSRALAFDASSRALAIDTAEDGLRAYRYDPASGWGSAELVVPRSANSAAPDDPVLAVSADGHAIVAWMGVDGVNVLEYDPNSGFGNGAAWPGTPGEWQDSLEVGLDACGEALVMWSHVQRAGLDDPQPPPEHLISRRIGGTWTEPEQLMSTMSYEPRLSVLENGVAIARGMVRRTDTLWEPYEDVVASSEGIETVVTARGDILKVSNWSEPERVMASRDDAQSDAGVEPETLAMGRFYDIAVTEQGTAIVVFAESASGSDLQVLRLE